MRRMTILSLGAGAWASLWLLLPLLVYRSLDEASDAQLQTLLRLVAAMSGLTVTQLVAGAAVSSFLLIAITSALLLVLIHYLDPARRGIEALRWSARTACCWAAWLSLIAIGAGLALLLERLTALGWVAWLIPVAAYLCAPFLCLRGDIVSMRAPPPLWWPRWPGTLPVILGLVWLFLGLFFSGTGAIVSWIQTDWMRWVLTAANEAAGWFATLAMASLAIGAWLMQADRSKLTEMRRRFVARKPIVALAVLDLRIAWFVVALVLAPIIVLAVQTIYILPEVQANLSSRNMPMPAAVQAMSATAAWVTQWWWLTVMPLAWFTLAWSGRAVHLAALETSPGPAKIG